MDTSPVARSFAAYLKLYQAIAPKRHTLKNMVKTSVTSLTRRGNYAATKSTATCPRIACV